MTHPPTPRTAPGTLHGSAARRALRHAAGLLLLASLPSAIDAMVQLGHLYGVTWPQRTVHYLNVINCAVAVALFFWLAWTVIGRTTLDRVTWRWRLVQRGVAVLCGTANLYVAAPGHGFGSFDGAILGITLAWLALEVCRSHGIVLERASGETDPRRRRALTWDLSERAFGVCFLGSLAASLLMWPLRLLGPETLPVMGDQLTTLGISSIGDVLAGVILAAALEDVVIVAATAALMTASNRPLWQIYTTIGLVEIAVHAYFGLPAIGMLAFAMGRIKLFLLYGRVLPLIFGHVAFDLTGILSMSLPRLYSYVVVVLLLLVLLQIGKRVKAPAFPDASSAVLSPAIRELILHKPPRDTPVACAGSQSDAASASDGPPAETADKTT
ncbi:hypothetical protein AB0H82_10955 [Streptomyces sp. NPDC050732]|uniref:hypothetical protein n=1 Tax=Streptomyces sp. NPDC050732 TaxID=3154632 RepID=UPI00342BE1F1